ncbi:bap28, putative, partial [Entamoeba invadens IP1]
MITIAQQLNTFVPTVSPSLIVSLIYEKNQAAIIDRYTLQHNASDAFDKLFKTHEMYEEWKMSLFSVESQETNRDLLTDAKNIELSKKIREFLPYTSRHFLNVNYGHIIEYMIRVYSIHILDADDLILSVLPYYQNALFMKLFHLCKPTIFANLVKLDKINKRTLVANLTQNPMYINTLATYFYDHTILYNNTKYTAFITTLLVQISQQQIVTESVMSSILTVVLKYIKSNAPKLMIIALTVIGQILSVHTLPMNKYISLLTILEKKISLSSPSQFIAVLCIAAKYQQKLDSFPLPIFKFIAASTGVVVSTLINLSKNSCDVSDFFECLIKTLIVGGNNKTLHEVVFPLVKILKLTKEHIRLIFSYICNKAKQASPIILDIESRPIITFLDINQTKDFGEVVNAYFQNADINNVKIANELKSILPASVNVPLYENGRYIGTIASIEQSGVVTNAAIIRMLSILQNTSDELTEMKELICSLFDTPQKHGFYISVFADTHFERLKKVLPQTTILNHLLTFSGKLPIEVLEVLMKYISSFENEENGTLCELFLPTKDTMYNALVIILLYQKYMTKGVFVLKKNKEELMGRVQKVLSQGSIKFSDVDALYFDIVKEMSANLDVSRLSDTQMSVKSGLFMMSVLNIKYLQTKDETIKNMMIDLLTLICPVFNDKKDLSKEKFVLQESTLLSQVLLSELELPNLLPEALMTYVVQLASEDLESCLDLLLVFPYESVQTVYNTTKIKPNDVLHLLISTPHFAPYIHEHYSSLTPVEVSTVVSVYSLFIMVGLLHPELQKRTFVFKQLEAIMEVTQSLKITDVKVKISLAMINYVIECRAEFTASNEFLPTFFDLFFKKMTSQEIDTFVAGAIELLKKDDKIDSELKLKMIETFGMRNSSVIEEIIAMIKTPDEIYETGFEQKVLQNVIENIFSEMYQSTFLNDNVKYLKLRDVFEMCNEDNLVFVVSLMEDKVFDVFTDQQKDDLFYVLSQHSKEKRTTIIQQFNELITKIPFKFINKTVGDVLLMIENEDKHKMEEEKTPQDKEITEKVQISNNVKNSMQKLTFIIESFLRTKNPNKVVDFANDVEVQEMISLVKNVVVLLQKTMKMKQENHYEYMTSVEMVGLTALITLCGKYLIYRNMVGVSRTPSATGKRRVIVVKSKKDAAKNEALEELADGIDVMKVVDVIYEVIGEFGNTPNIYNNGITLISQLIAVFPNTFVEHSDRFVRAISKDEIVGIVVQKLIPQVILTIKTTTGLPGSAVVELLMMIVDNFTQLAYHRRLEIFVHLFKETKIDIEHIAGVIILLLENEGESVIPFVMSIMEEMSNGQVIDILSKLIECGTLLIKKTAESVLSGYIHRIVKPEDDGKLCLELVNKQITKKEFVLKCMKCNEDLSIQQSYTTLFKQVVEGLNLFDNDETNQNTSNLLRDMVDNIADLFSITTLIRAVIFLIKQSGIWVKRTALMILNQKLTDLSPEDMLKYEGSFLSQDNGLIHVVIKILENVNTLNASSEDKEAEIGTVQTGVLLLEILLRFYGAAHVEIFSDLLPYVLNCVRLTNPLRNVKIVASALLCLSIYASELKETLLPQLPELVPMFFDLLPETGDEDSVNSLINSVISCVMMFTKSYKNVIAPYVSQFVSKILNPLYTTNAMVLPSIVELMHVMSSSLEFRLIVQMVSTNYKEKLLQNDTSLSAIFTLISSGLSQKETNISNVRTLLYNFLFEVLDLVPTLESPLNMKHCVTELVNMFSALVMKLSDDTFKPFFMKLSDNFGEKVKQKKVNAMYLYAKVIVEYSKTLKSLFVPYYTFFLTNLVKILAELPISLATMQLPESNVVRAKKSESDNNSEVVLETIYLAIELLQGLFLNDKQNFVDTQKITLLVPIVNLLDSMHNCVIESDDYFDVVSKRLSPCFVQFALCVPNQVC